MEWRSSTYTQGGDCLELAWRTSSFSGAGNDCVELAWRTSSYTNQECGNCVEVACCAHDEAVLLRDTKCRAGGTLTLDGAAWRGLLTHARTV